MRGKSTVRDSSATDFRALAKEGRYQEALVCCNRAIEIDPCHRSAHWIRSLIWLLQGDYERGWPEYEWRLQWRPDKPRWDGSSFDRLLVHAEQGHGDAIQFVRYLPMVKERGKRVILECRENQVSLFRWMGIDVVSHRDRLPKFDSHIPLMSLPLIFGTTLNTIPNKVPYLQGKKISLPLGDYNIGLVWSGKPGYQTSFEIFKNLPLKFFSLQKGLNEKPVFTDLSSRVTNFHDTASLIQQMDLIISMDTSVAHLAGALGKPTWTLVPYSPDWRWMLDREDSPWYPSMRLFRQPKPGDWQSVVKRIYNELEGL